MNDDYEPQNDYESQNEPVILSLEAYRRSEPNDDGRPPEGSDHDDEPRVESYWAGRNHAMRRSSRIAA